MIGDPTEETPARPASGVRGQRRALGRAVASSTTATPSPDGGIDAGSIDERDGSVHPYEILGIASDENGLTVGASEQDVLAIHPGLSRDQFPAQQGGGGARPAQMFFSDTTSPYPRTYMFLPENLEGLWTCRSATSADRSAVPMP